MSDELSGCDLGEVEVLARTDKAVRVELDGNSHWIPFSQIHDDSEIYETTKVGERGTLVVSHWLGRQLGFE